MRKTGGDDALEQGFDEEEGNEVCDGGDFGSIMIVGKDIIKNMPNSGSKTRHIFAFLGVTELGTDANIIVLESRLDKLLSEYNQLVKIKRKGDLLSLALTNPDFCFYVAFVKNDSGEFPHWVDLAANFGLQWDRKPVTATRLRHIFEWLEKNGKPEYKTYEEIGFAILNELEKFTNLKVFTIPSFEKRSIWYKIFKDCPPN